MLFRVEYLAKPGIIFTGSWKTMKVIDLFAGAGGLSEGFRQENYEIIAHVEMDKSACNTLKTREAFYYLKEKGQLHTYLKYLNKELSREEFYELVPEKILKKVINEEISNKSIKNIFSSIDELLDGETIDMIIGGPPCQAYSSAGIARDPNRMKDDPRNYFYRYYVRFLKKYNPKIFVFENVKGILTAQEGKIFKNIKRNMSRAGYKMDYKILNARDFGVSQNRERVIIIGWKKEIDFYYPEFEATKNTPFLQTLFSDLPKLNAGDSIEGNNVYVSEPKKELSFLRDKSWTYLSQHISRPNNPNDLEIYKLIVETWNKNGRILKYNELPKKLITHNNTSSFLDRYKMLHYSDVSHTIVAHISKDGHYYIHPDVNQNRSLTVREAARIQAFPDDFYFEDSRTAAFKQIGNAVPPLMARIIAQKIKMLFCM